MMMFINKYEANDNGCKLCTEYFERSGCTARSCPYIAQRIESGLIDYKGLIYETFSKDENTHDRLLNLINTYTGTLWSNIQHKTRMNKLKASVIYRRHRDTNSYYAAMYLLTANKDIYRRTQKCFTKCGIVFKNAELKDISLRNYVIYDAAQIIYEQTQTIPMSYLYNKAIVDNEAFRLIINAVLIDRYGLNVFLLNENN